MNILHINSNHLYTTLFDHMIEEMDFAEHVIFSPISGKIKFSINPKENVYCPVTFRKYDRFFFFKKQRKILCKLEECISVEKYNVIHAHTLFTDGNVAYELKKKYKIPYIVAVRNTDINTFFKYRLNLRNLGVEILKNAEKIIFLSQSYLDVVLEKYIDLSLKNSIIEKSLILPNGIDNFWFENLYLDRNNKRFTNQINVIYAGKINKNKNVLNSAKAIEKLRNKKNLNINFNVVGEIQDKKIHKKLESYDFINFTNNVPKDELINIYRANDIFIMPSYKETFGLVYAEAMSQGLPVIYSKGQGFDKQFSEGLVGYHVNSRNINDIANKIEIISKDSNISKRCLNNVDKFKWSNISKEYYEIYSKIR